VIHAARLRPGWRVQVIGIQQHPADSVRADPPDAVLGRFLGSQLTEALAERSIPAVATSNTGVDLPRVGVNEAAIGQLAANELSALGFEHFAVVPFGQGGASAQRQQAFTEAIAARRLPCAAGPLTEDEAEGAAWLAAQPAPLAVFATNDMAGARVLRWAEDAGRHVPDELAVLGVDDDDLICETAATPLSSIAIPGRRIGEIAVEMLEQLFTDGAADPPLRLLEPTGVVHRRSTETQVATDPDLAAALSFIRDHAREPITVGDVLDAVMISRRKLEGEFKRVLGHSPAAEIRRVRVERAKRLLSASDLSLPAVAEASGLGSRVQLNRVFRKATGHTPAAYRRMYRA